MKLGIDPGKYGTKAVTMINEEWHKLYIRSKYTENPDNIILGDNYLINHQGISFLVGEGGSDYSLDADKQILQHKLCTYIAISQLANDQEVIAVVGYPFKLFTNSYKRESYKSFLLEDKVIDITVNQIDTTLYINDIIPFPECGGVAYAEPEEDFIGNVRGVIDIGGLNVNGCLFENLNPIEGSEFTENLGSIILKDKIKSELNKQYPEINLQDYDIAKILKNGLFINGKKEDRANEIIRKVLAKHFEKIINVAKKKNWSINTLDITVSGGGSLDIGIESIKLFIHQAKLSSDPVWDNAKGFWVVADMLYEG